MKHSSRPRRAGFALACLSLLAASALLGVRGVPSVGAAGACGNEAIRAEQHSTFLSDCRAYEMVSPPEKNGGEVVPSTLRTRAAAGGDAAGFISLAGFGGVEGTDVAVDYLAHRSDNSDPGDNGWVTRAISPLKAATSATYANGLLQTSYQGEFSPDLSSGILFSPVPVTSEPLVAEQENLYLRRNLLGSSSPSYELITRCPQCEQANTPLPNPMTLAGGTEPVLAPQTAQPWLDGTSSDLSHVLFQSQMKLTDDAQQCTTAIPGTRCVNLYEFHAGAVSSVGEVPPVGASECGASGPACESTSLPVIAGEGGDTLGNGVYSPRTISSDGSHVVFTARVPQNVGSTIRGRLYLRIDSGTPDARTVRVDASERTDCADHDPCNGTPEPDPAANETAHYQYASADGNRVFFSSFDRLSDDAMAGDSIEKLYVFDLTKPVGQRLSLVFSDEAPDDGQASFEGGVIGGSEDGQYLYFLAPGQLISGEPLLATNTLGIYLWHDGALTYIGGEIPVNSEEVEGLLWSGSSKWHEVKARMAEVSPSGKQLLFRLGVGTNLLSGYGGTDIEQSGCSEVNGSPRLCREFYVYDAAQDNLQCASCRSGGQLPGAGDATFFTRKAVGAAIGSAHLPHVITDDGRYAFFSTSAPLVDEDTNGVSDAYAFDTETGEPHLLSSGTSPDPSYFMDADANGQNAFFVTRQRLVGWDSDEGYDLYDARVGGGFPEPVAKPAACGSGTCRGAGPAAPSAGAGAVSASFSGPGNAKPARKHKKVRKHRGQKAKHHKGSKRDANKNRRAGR